MAAQFCEYTKKKNIKFKWVNWILCELYHKEIIM